MKNCCILFVILAFTVIQPNALLAEDATTAKLVPEINEEQSDYYAELAASETTGPLANRYADKAIAYNPKSAKAYLTKAMVIRDAKAAVPYFRKAVDFGAGVAENHTQYALALMATGEYSAAKREIEIAITLDGKSLYNYFFAAECSLRMNDRSAAIVSLKELLSKEKIWSSGIFFYSDFAGRFTINTSESDGFGYDKDQKTAKDIEAMILELQSNPAMLSLFNFSKDITLFFTDIVIPSTQLNQKKMIMEGDVWKLIIKNNYVFEQRDKKDAIIKQGRFTVMTSLDDISDYVLVMHAVDSSVPTSTYLRKLSSNFETSNIAKIQIPVLEKANYFTSPGVTTMFVLQFVRIIGDRVTFLFMDKPNQPTTEISFHLRMEN